MAPAVARMLTMLVVLGGCGRLGFVGHSADGSIDGRVDGAIDGAIDADGAAADATGDAADAAMDGEAMDAADARPDVAPPDGGLSPFDPPTELTSVNSGGHDHSASMTGDLLELFFESARAGDDDIWTTTRATPTSPFGAPVRVAALSTGATETSAEVSRDGLTIYFASDRAPSLGGVDVWMATRASRDGAWNPPAHVPELSSSAHDHNAALGVDGLSIVVQSERDGDSDLYLATRPTTSSPWSALAELAELSSAGSDAHGHLGPGELTIHFASDRAGGMGGRDLYVARRASTALPFGPPEPLTELNTSGLDDEPWVSDDERYILFTAVVPGGRGLFEARR